MAKATLYTPEMIEKYTQAGYWEPMALSDYWERNARLYPAKEALVDARVRLTWAQAKVWMDRLALSLLELGLKKDDMVVAQLPNCVELVLLRVACERAGLLFLPAMRTLRHTEMEYILRFTGAVAMAMPWKYRDFDYLAMIEELRPNLPSVKHILIAGDEVPPGTISLRDMFRKPLETKYPSDYLDARKCPATEVSLVALTTGTTGAPKFVETPACARIRAAKVMVKDFAVNSQDVMAALSPAALGPNVAVYYIAPLMGTRSILMEHWSVEEGLKLIERERVTYPSVVPTQLAEIAEYPDLKRYDLSSIRAIFCTGSFLPYHLGVEIEAKLGRPIVQSYGAVDFGGMAEVSIDDPQDVRLSTIGRPYPGSELKLIDASGKEVAKGEIGEIVIQGPTGASGLYKDPETTAKSWDKDGWYRTGDLAKWDNRGNLTIVGREKDMIIRGGQNIYPLEVETLLLTHPKVLNAAVVSIPDPIMGEKACACIVPQPGQEFTLQEMTAFLKTKRIAAYKLPEKLVLRDSLPYVGGLKLDRKALRASIIEWLKARGEI